MMTSIEGKYISAIAIPDWDKGVTANNSRFFDFRPDLPDCLRGKRAALQVSLLVAGFISTYIYQHPYMRIIMLFLTFAVCVWFTFDARHTRTYLRLLRSFTFSRYGAVRRCIHKLTHTRRIFIEDMPSVYWILKAKLLMEAGDYVAADYLADKTLARQQGCAEALYIKILCRYALGKGEEARLLLDSLRDMSGKGGYMKYARELLSA